MKIMLKVNRIFSSFQGEGVYAGTPATFLRLSGCNLNCCFCDTDFKDYHELPISMVKSIIEEHMTKHKTNILVITGGEPLLQYPRLKQLIQELNCKVQIETNGTIIKTPLNATYMISPKTDINRIFQYYKKYDNTYFKFIIQNELELHQIKEMLRKYNYNKEVYLQPVYQNAQEITKLILSKNLPFKYRISGQLHKYLGVE